MWKTTETKKLGISIKTLVAYLTVRFTEVKISHTPQNEILDQTVQKPC